MAFMIFYGNEDVVHMETWLLIKCGLQNHHPFSGCGKRHVQADKRGAPAPEGPESHRCSAVQPCGRSPMYRENWSWKAKQLVQDHQWSSEVPLDRRGLNPSAMALRTMMRPPRMLNIGVLYLQLSTVNSENFSLHLGVWPRWSPQDSVCITRIKAF